MITRKELEYVSSWARFVPTPGVDYSLSVLTEIKKCVDLFNEQYYGKKYEIIFSDNSEAIFEIEEKNLCHLLGVDFSNLKDNFWTEFRHDVLGLTDNNFTSYELLNLIIQNAEEVARYDNDLSVRSKALNYYKARIKCEIFNKLTDFSHFNFAAWQRNGDASDYDIDLFAPSDEAVCPYFSIVLSQSDTRDNEYDYFVKSLHAIDDPQKYFENNGQIVIPTQILNYNGEIFSKIQATPEEKLRLLDMYNNLMFRYGINAKLNILGDYAMILADMNSGLARTKSRN